MLLPTACVSEVGERMSRAENGKIKELSDLTAHWFFVWSWKEGRKRLFSIFHSILLEVPYQCCRFEPFTLSLPVQRNFIFTSLSASYMKAFFHSIESTVMRNSRQETWHWDLLFLIFLLVQFRARVLKQIKSTRIPPPSCVRELYASWIHFVALSPRTFSNCYSVSLCSIVTN